MRLSDGLTGFFLTKDLTPKSVSWYTENLERFFTWLRANETDTVEGIAVELVRRYIAEQRTTPGTQTGRPPSSATIHGYMRAIKSFLNWAAEEGIIDPTMMTRLRRMPKVHQTVVPVFSARQVDALLRAAADQDCPELAARDQAIVAVLLDTGIRANELCTLTLDHTTISSDLSFVVVRGKGRKDREIGLGKRASTLLHRYVSRHRGAPPEVPWTFLSRNGTALTPLGLQKLLHRMRNHAGIEGIRVSPHSFRHTFAVNYLEAGGDVFRLSRVLGHADITTTQGYLKAFQARAARGALSVFDNAVSR